MRASACGSRESLLRASAARGSALSELIVRCFCSERDAVLCADPGGNNNLILGITIPKPPAQRAVQTPVPRSGLHLTASRAAGYTDTGPAQRATFDSMPCERATGSSCFSPLCTAAGARRHQSPRHCRWNQSTESEPMLPRRCIHAAKCH